MLGVVLIALWAHLAQAEDTFRYVSAAVGDDVGDCTESGAPCRTITYALGQAAPGDSILVARGTYTEHVVLDKDVMLLGGYEESGWTRDISQYETIIDGSNSGSVVRIESACRLEGFTVTKGRAEGNAGGGVSVKASGVTINAMTVYGNLATWGGGIAIEPNSDVTVTNSLLRENVAIFGGGLGVYGGAEVSYARLSGLVVLSNTTPLQAAGIYVENAHVEIDNPTIRYNVTATESGLGVLGGAVVTVTGGIISDNKADYWGGGIGASSWEDGP